MNRTATIWQRIRAHPRFLKTFHWEYWQLSLASLPTFLFYLLFACKARHLFFFTTVNPTIETGGVFGESKISILRQLPQAWVPPTVFIPGGQEWAQTREALSQAKLQFPLIAKPNVGERGLLVTKVSSAVHLRSLLAQYPVDFLLQPFVTLPEEVSILYYRKPETKRGRITSICIKEQLSVTGDGCTTIESLMKAKPRARLQLPRFQREQPDWLQEVPAHGQRIVLEPIGNHSRGTKFLDGNHLVNPSMESFFDGLSHEMPDIYYGRFDLKCDDPARIGQGARLQILEYNGIAADPAHIYDPEIPIWKKYQTIFRHWRIIYDLSRQQRSRGLRPDHWRTIKRYWKGYRNYLKSVRTYEARDPQRL